MSLSGHLLKQTNGSYMGSMPPPDQMPIQTPQTPGGGGFPGHVMDGQSSQWGSHHGSQMLGFGYGSQATPRFTQWSEERVAMMQSRLNKKLGPEYISQRPGGGGSKFTYVPYLLRPYANPQLCGRMERCAPRWGDRH